MDVLRRSQFCVRYMFIFIFRCVTDLMTFSQKYYLLSGHHFHEPSGKYEFRIKGYRYCASQT